MASKQAIGRLTLPDDARRWLPHALEELRCEPLALSFDHALEAALLPLHRRDPFDRFLIAQSRCGAPPSSPWTAPSPATM